MPVRLVSLTRPPSATGLTTLLWAAPLHQDAAISLPTAANTAAKSRRPANGYARGSYNSGRVYDSQNVPTPRDNFASIG